MSAPRSASLLAAAAFWALTAVCARFADAQPAVQIQEVLAGANGDSRVQYLDLRFEAGESWGPGPGETAGRAVLVFHDASGAVTGTFVFPSDPPTGPPDARGLRSALIATRGFADLPGAPAPDYILPPGLLAAGGGKVCFRSNPLNPSFSANLCLSYGDFAGPTEADTSEPPQPAGPPAAALPTTGVRALKRFRNFGAGFLGQRQFNADFQLGPAEGRNSQGAIAHLEMQSLIDQGRTLFFQETFQGNGRTCGTCHLAAEAFALSPQAIAALPADDPLFVFERVPQLRDLEDAEHLRGPRGLILENIDGFDKPHLLRGSPPLINIGLTAPFGLSGEIETLGEFTTGAVKQHFPRTLGRNADPGAGPLDFRLPAEEELEAMSAFQESLRLELRLDLMLASAVFRGADVATLRRGRAIFFGEDAKCFKCHGGPTLAEVDPSLVAAGVVPSPGNHAFNTGVAQRGALRGLSGTHEVERRFSTRPLVGVALRKAFFHDHSALTLQDAVDFYCSGCDDNFFETSPAAQEIGGLKFNLFDDRVAVTAFLEALVEPAPECARAPDCNANGIADLCETAAFPERDCDGDGTPDSCESDTIDCDANGIADACDISTGASPDCNQNAVPDGCDIGGGASRDCNRDGVPDECERGGLLDVSDPAFLTPGRGVALGSRPQGVPPFAVSRAGDLNADGLSDVLIGAKPAEAAPLDLPVVFVLFGRRDLGAEGPLDLGRLDGGRGFRVTGFTERQSSQGFEVAAAGDLNGDGAADFLVGDQDASPGGRTAAGAAFLIFGRSGLGGSGSLSVETLDGRSGFAIEGAKAVDHLGSSTAGGRDLNADGLPDIVVGAPFADPGRNAAGEVYVIFGGAAAVAGPRLLPSMLDGVVGFALQGGRATDLAGSAVALARDVNGDGVDDLLIGAPGADPGGRESAGETYVVFGAPALGAGGTLPLSSLNGSNGFTIRGARALDANLLIAVASAGDMNGDRFGDILVGAHNAQPDGRLAAGEAYVVFGGSEVGRTGAIELESLAGDAGFVLKGHQAGDRLGALVSALDDLNGDGFDDILVGTGGGREAYLIYGSPTVGRGGPVDPHGLSGGAGMAIRLHGGKVLPESFILNAASAVGDPTGDGVPDLALGLRLSSPDPSLDPGRLFLLFGPLYPADCNLNRVPDSCEIAESSVPDANENGVPDGCERGEIKRRFRRGDVNADGLHNIADPVNTLFCLLLGASCSCRDAADADDSGRVDITDPLHDLSCLFLGGPCPPPPYGTCGFDPSDDGLDCAAHPACR